MSTLDRMFLDDKYTQVNIFKEDVYMITLKSQSMIDKINDKIMSGEFSSIIRPYGQLKKAENDDEIARYGQYYIWDRHVDHLMAADVSLEYLAGLVELESNTDRMQKAA